MRQFLSLVVVFVTSIASAQQLTVMPGTGESLSLAQVDTLSPGQYVAAGYIMIPIPVSDSDTVAVQLAIVVRFSQTNFLWAKAFGDPGSQVNAIAISDLGNIVAVGRSSSKALAMCLDPNGNLLWSKTFTSGSSTFLNVKIASNGDIYAVGSRTNRKLVARLDSTGNLIWIRVESGSTSSRANNLVINGDSIIVFGQFGSATKDVDVRVLDSNCNESLNRTFGDPALSEFLTDIVASGPGAYTAAVNNNVFGTVGVFALTGDFHLTGDAVNYTVFGAETSNAFLSTIGQETYLFCQVTSGVAYAQAARLSASLVPVWNRTVDANASAARPVMDGDNIILPSDASVGSTIPMVSTIDQASGLLAGSPCEIPPQQTLVPLPYPNILESDHPTQVWSDPGYVVDGTLSISGETLVIISCGGSLPIELTSFTAKANGRVVNLDWTTATEHNNAYFTIERSQDGLVFEEVVRVDGAGDSQSELRYEATDEKPFSGTSYYRLRQTDNDGSSTTSNVVAVELKGFDLELSIRPSLATPEEFIFVDTDKPFEVISSDGRVVREVAGGSRGFKVEGSGNYIIRTIENTPRFARLVVTQ